MKKEVLITLGTRIRERRKSLNMTQEVLAAVADLDRSYVGGIERGERNITIEMLGKVCTALHCDIAALTYDLPEASK